jgi:hypothetical protein
MEYKYTWLIIGDRAGLCLDWIWAGCQLGEAQIACVPPVSIEDRPLLWTLVRSLTYYPEHILAYESGKACYSLVMSFGSFRIDCYGWIIG